MASTTHAQAGSILYARALAEAIEADGDDKEPESPRGWDGLDRDGPP